MSWKKSAATLVFAACILSACGSASSRSDAAVRNGVVVAGSVCKKPGQVATLSRQKVVCAGTRVGNRWFSIAKTKSKAKPVKCKRLGTTRKKSGVLWVCASKQTTKVWVGTLALPVSADIPTLVGVPSPVDSTTGTVPVDATPPDTATTTTTSTIADEPDTTVPDATTTSTTTTTTSTTTTTTTLPPVAPTASALQASTVSAGGNHSCALVTGGAVNCWGDNSSGQLGNATFTNSNIPVRVTGLDGVNVRATAVSAGEAHSCALLVGGAVWCWGLNATGQLGNATIITSNVPVAVSGLDGVSNVATQVSAGAGHTCAVLSTGALNCWGSNETAQLGDNSTTNSNVPIATSTIDGVTLRATQVSAGYLHTCAVLQSGAAMCWGDNTSGQLGINATTAQVNTPASVVTTAMSTAVASVSAGYLHTCVVLVNGAVWCWGDNSSGQLGINSSVTNKITPTIVVGLDGIALISTHVASATSHTCARIQSGGLRCWGYNFYGALGTGNTNDARSPVTVIAASGGSPESAIVVTTGGTHTCAVLTGGGVRCWGNNEFGQWGQGT